ncbi:hypothetical protein MMC29_001472, partial [Sticta canariensis]|nr:hypothetical protein [Sticta canariensis]
VSTCVVQDSVPKIQSKHLVLKASVAEIKTRLLVDNDSKAEFIDEFFVRMHQISTFKLNKNVKLELNPAINWKNCTMRFNLASCMEKTCLLHGIPCIKYAISSK